MIFHDQEACIMPQNYRFSADGTESASANSPAVVLYIDKCLSLQVASAFTYGYENIVVTNATTFGWHDNISDAGFYSEVANHFPSTIIVTADSQSNIRSLASTYAGKVTLLTFSNNNSGTESQINTLKNLLNTSPFKRIENWPQWFSYISVNHKSVKYYDLRQKKWKETDIHTKFRD